MQFCETDGFHCYLHYRVLTGRALRCAVDRMQHGLPQFVLLIRSECFLGTHFDRDEVSHWVPPRRIDSSNWALIDIDRGLVVRSMHSRKEVAQPRVVMFTDGEFRFARHSGLESE